MKITIETDGNVIYKCEDEQKNITDTWCEHCDNIVRVESDRRGVTGCIYKATDGPRFAVNIEELKTFPVWFEIKYCPFCGKRLRR